VAPGDILDPAALAAALEGCRVVFHVAGVNETCLADPAPMYRANVDGTVAVVRAAAAAGVERVVYTSSLAAIGERAGEVATEDTVHCGEYPTHYARSKHHAELAGFTEADRLGVDLVAVNPASVQGPGRTGGTARILIGFLSGRLRFAVDTTLSLVSIDDTARAHLLAAERGVPGERYLVSGAMLSVREAVATLGEIAGIDREVRYLPAWLVSAGATAVGGACRLAGVHPPACREMARVLRRGARCDGSRAERDLGLAYTPLEEWLGETIDWYRAEGLA
jgi:dihydroflavonol-4-reductase